MSVEEAVVTQLRERGRPYGSRGRGKSADQRVHATIRRTTSDSARRSSATPGSVTRSPVTRNSVTGSSVARRGETPASTSRRSAPARIGRAWINGREVGGDQAAYPQLGTTALD